MLQDITTEQVKHIANLAKEARSARDLALLEVPERDFSEPKPGRGAHNPGAAIGFDPLPALHPARVALRNAIAALSDEARAELLALAWVGRGEYGAKDWQRAIPASITILAAAGIDFLADEVDLHDQLTKGLYELKMR